MQEQKKYTFNHSLYQLSTDYKKLWDLIQSGHKIPAWIVYTDKYEKEIWDLVEVKNNYMNSNEYDIGTRGHSYLGQKGYVGFLNICQMLNLHFING